jgi:VWFA-related protein
VLKSALSFGVSLALCGLAVMGFGKAVGGVGNAARNDSTSAPAPAYRDSTASGKRAEYLSSLSDTDHLPARLPDFTIRRAVREVRLQFTVADAQGRAVTQLSAADVRVWDNQALVSQFTEFQRSDDLPLFFGLLLDTSNSVTSVLPEEKAAASRFLTRILRPDMDSAFVMAFGGDLKLWQPSTSNREQLSEAIRRLQGPGWGTRFYDALYAACNAPVQPSDEMRVHRAVVVLSDGDDTQSLHGLRDIIGAAQSREIQIYALAIRAGKAWDRGDLVLERLADATGGRVYFARSSQDLDGAFAQIEQDLRTQYYVSFPPSQPARAFHSLRVEVRGPNRLEVHARQGYYAAAP